MARSPTSSSRAPNARACRSPMRASMWPSRSRRSSTSRRRRLSCPTKPESSAGRGSSNPCRGRELYREELAAMVGARSPAIAWYAQKPSFFSVIAPEAAAGEAQVIETDEANPGRASPKLESPLYFLLAASRDREALGAVPALVSVFSDRDEWMRRDYEKVFRWMEDSVARAKALDAEVAERDRSIAALQAPLHPRDAELAVRHLAVSEKEREIERRRGWRWWLKLPLVRMGLLK